jgi:glycosyltransferase involved in cell wall biosynthesis
MVALIEHLDRSRVKPFALTTGPGELTDRLRELDCPVFHLDLVGLKLPNLPTIRANIRGLRAIFREHAIDIVHPDSERDAVICGLACLGRPTKMVWHVRLTNSNNLDGLSQRLADMIIGISDGTRRRFTESTLRTKYRTIYNGVDLRLFHPADDIPALRTALGIPLNRIILLFVGQIKIEKGIFELVEAMSIIQSNGEAPLPLLLMIGTADDAGVERDLQQLIADRTLERDIQLRGQQPDIQRWMQAADLLALPSYEGKEGMGRVVFEAMACGVVPIASDISGTREAITPESGVLVPEKSPEALAGAITRLIVDPALRNRLRDGAMERARTTFDINVHARAVEQAYRDLLGR